MTLDEKIFQERQAAALERTAGAMERIAFALDALVAITPVKPTLDPVTLEISPRAGFIALMRVAHGATLRELLLPKQKEPAQ